MTLFALIVMVTTPTIASTPDDTGDRKVAVAILYFENQSGLAEYDYLGNSIALTLEKSIKAPQRFEFIEYKISKKKAEDLGYKNTAGLGIRDYQKIARAVGAHVSLKGSYSITLDPKEGAPAIELRGGIYKTSTAEFLGDVSAEGKMDETIFDAIDSFAADLSAVLAENVPADVGSFLTVYEATLVPQMALNLGYSADYFPQGVGAGGAYNMRHLVRDGDLWGVSIGYLHFASSRVALQSLDFLSMGGSIGYELYLLERWSVIPRILGGLDVERVVSTGEGSRNFLMGYFGLGLESRYKISRRFFLLADVAGHFQMDAEILPLFTAGAGAGVVF